MHIHFIAIGGSVMHSLAVALHLAGHTITGSDDVVEEPARSRLQQFGLMPQPLGWFPEKIHDRLNAVIVGMHAQANNPELVRAIELQLPVYSFPQFLFEHAKHKQRIVVAGSHGKTTITAMVMHILQKAKIDFDYIVGASVAGFEHSVRLSPAAPIMVFEGDEYPDSALDGCPKFVRYQAHAALISGIAWDHINVFPTEEVYQEAFRQLLESLQPQALLLYCQEEASVRTLVHNAHGDWHALPYGMPRYVPTPHGWHIHHDGQRYPLRLFGRHNMLNAAGAAMLCQHVAGLSAAFCYSALTDFHGAALRLQNWIQSPALIAYRDFAHAPSKLKATLAAVREQHPTHQLICCFELHTYSSLDHRFLPTYHQAMQLADVPIVMVQPDVAARKGLEPVSTSFLKQCFADDRLLVVHDAEQLLTLLAQRYQPPSVWLLMSSGSLGNLNAQRLLTFAQQLHVGSR